MTLIVCPGPAAIATAEDDRPMRFCFACRKHLLHTWALLDDPPERQPSYYESVPVLRCSQCHRDCASFPGMYIDGPRYPSEDVWRVLTDRAREVRATWDWDAIWERVRTEEEAWATVDQQEPPAIR